MRQNLEESLPGTVRGKTQDMTLLWIMLSGRDSSTDSIKFTAAVQIKVTIFIGPQCFSNPRSWLDYAIASCRIHALVENGALVPVSEGL